LDHPFCSSFAIYSAALLLQQLGEPKIQHLYVAVTTEHDVLWLNITVKRFRPGELQQEQMLLDFATSSPVADPFSPHSFFAERNAFDIFSDDKMQALCLTELMNS